MCKPLFFVALYFLMWMATWPAILGDLQHLIDDKEIEAKHCRKDMGSAMFLALLPPIWLFVPFETGLYEDGFQFTCGGRK
jgi:hypothetical protein